MAKKPLKIFKVNNISEVRDVDSLYCIKTPTDTEFTIVVTDAFGAIVNLKDLQTPAGIQGIASDDGTIEVTGATFKNLRLSATLVNAINSSLKTGDNISELVNDAGYITDVNLSYTATPTNGTIVNDRGNDATIPLADVTNAGLISAAEKAELATALQPSDITNLVPYTGATTNVDLGEYQLKTGQLELDQTPTGTFSTGNIRWNDAAGTAEIRLKGNSVTLQLGQELVKRVVNKTATNITLQESNYQVVRIIGATGQRLSVDLAQADSEANSASTLGLVTENIANNQEGFITFSGEINLINTTGSLQGETWIDGDVLYLSPTIAGGLTKVVPTAPNHSIRVGYVQYAHATQGKIHVDVDRGYSLENLHNVKITATTAGKILGSTTEGLWENKSVAEILGYIPQAKLIAGANITIDETDPLAPIISADTTPTSVGVQQYFYLDSTSSLADNFTLSNTPSAYPETADLISVTTGLSPVFFERFVSQPLGKTSIPAGTWRFNIYASTSNNTGLNVVDYRINKRVIINGIIGTWTGAGVTRTFTASSGTPFAGLTASGNRLTAPLIETPNQTGWVSAVISDTVVTVKITDTGYVNESGVSLNAIYYWMFGGETGDITGATANLYTVTSSQPEFTGLNLNDRLVIALFATTDQVAARTMTLYYGGTEHFTYFESPLSVLHNDLGGLNVGDYQHITVAEKASFVAKENVANKSDSYTASSSTTYASTKALVDGLALKANLSGGNSFTGNQQVAGNIGIGAVAGVALDISGTSFASSQIRSVTSSNSDNSVLAFRRARSGNTSILNTDSIGNINFRGHDGASFGNDVASIGVIASQNFTTTQKGTSLNFKVTPIGSTSMINPFNIFGTKVTVDYDFSNPTEIQPAFTSDVKGKGDNATYKGVVAGNFIARDRSDVTVNDKGVLIALNVGVKPIISRNNVPFDDVNGIMINNEGVGKGTDAIYFSKNSNSFASTSQWLTLITSDTNADYGIRLMGVHSAEYLNFANKFSVDNNGKLKSSNIEPLLNNTHSIGTDALNYSFIRSNVFTSNTALTFDTPNNNSIVFKQGGTEKARLFNSGNLRIQNGGSLVDDGVNQLQLTGSAISTAWKVQGGTTAQYQTGTGSLINFDSGVRTATLTGFTSGAGTVSATDTVLQAIQKLDGNVSSITDSQVEIGANTNVLNTWNGKTILFTANCTVTVPSTLINQLSFVFRTLAGVTVTWAITAPFTWETTPTTTPEKTTGNFMRRGSTNTILLDF